MSDVQGSEGLQLTKVAFDRLKAELEELQTKGRSDIATRLQRARELGDLSENAEYHETKNQQGLMEARIRKLEHMIKNAQIVEAPTKVDRVQPGTYVTLRPVDEPSGEDELYLLAASSEERAPGARTVTVQSPLGQAVNGRLIGDRIEYEAPGGTFAYEVVKIEPWGAGK